MKIMANEAIMKHSEKHNMRAGATDRSWWLLLGQRCSWTPHTEHLTLMRVATREAVSTGRVIVDAVRLGAGGIRGRG